MRKGTKIWLIVAASLFVFGALVFVGAMTAHGWNFMNLSTVKVSTNTYEIEEAFANISVDTDTADVVFALSEDGRSRVTCDEEKKLYYSVSVQDGTLRIDRVDERRWYDSLRIFDFHSKKITVYLPQSEYAALSVKGSTGNVDVPSGLKFTTVDIRMSTGKVNCSASATELIRIKTSTGDVTVDGISAGALDLIASTGDVKVKNVSCAGNVAIHLSTGDTTLTGVRCKNLITEGDTGKLTMTDVIAAERFEIERETGDVRFEACDAAELDIETDTGDVKGSLLTEKVFFVETDTGEIEVPRTMSGGRCEISTDTGDVKISIYNQ